MNQLQVMRHALAKYMPEQPQPIELGEVEAVLTELSKRMKASGFSELDLRILFDARDFICGDTK